MAGATPAFATSTPGIKTPAQLLAESLPGVVHLPGSAEYATAVLSWNTTANQMPAAVAVPTTAELARRSVENSIDAGFRVSAQGTGHAAAVLAQHDLSDVVLVRTHSMRGVTLKQADGTVRIEAGAQWRDVIAETEGTGLVALHGSAPTVGVVGYALGGGLGWYARKYGLAANSVRSVELVDADGAIVQASATENAELFWAVRGGAGNFGVVTALELELFPVGDVYAGMMLFPFAQVKAVMQAYAAWSKTAPDEVTASLRIIRAPGNTMVMLDAVVIAADAAEGEAVMAGMAAAGPFVNTFTMAPTSTLTDLHGDPVDPTASRGNRSVLRELTDDTIDTILASAAPGVSDGIAVFELRLLGGALSRAAAGGGALDMVAGSHLYVVLAGLPANPDAATLAVVQGQADVAAAAVGQWSTGQALLNFADGPAAGSEVVTAASWSRLQNAKATFDPNRVFVANLDLT